MHECFGLESRRTTHGYVGDLKKGCLGGTRPTSESIILVQGEPCGDAPLTLPPACQVTTSAETKVYLVIFRHTSQYS
jgi:hypothetical protein